MSDIYGKTVVLKKELRDIECWNWIGPDRVILPAGTSIRTLHANDATQTTIGVTEPRGLDFSLPDGSTRTGYRFIVPNDLLREATGLPFPQKTQDLVGDILRFEGGEMDEQETREFLGGLRKAGLLGQLQGSYGRAAAALGV